MKPELDWRVIDTVLLDMDGTLLDLHFDNFFWQEYLPDYWGQQNNMASDKARKQLKEWYAHEFGTLSWYCLDFWTERLQFNVLALKTDLEHLIDMRPHAESFLQRLNKFGYHVVMVTNTHEKLIEIKMQKTRIDKHFEKIISAHRIGHAKEEQAFWQKLHDELQFDPKTTILVDDNLSVLKAARQFGIQYLLSIAKPDSQSAEQDTEDFRAVQSFQDLVF